MNVVTVLAHESLLVLGAVNFLMQFGGPSVPDLGNNSGYAGPNLLVQSITYR